jgi:hypothetical protein
MCDTKIVVFQLANKPAFDYFYVEAEKMFTIPGCSRGVNTVRSGQIYTLYYHKQLSMRELMNSLSKIFTWKPALVLGTIFLVFLASSLIIDSRSFSPGWVSFLIVGFFLVITGMYGYVNRRRY